jgi:hypothetical protein
MKTFVAQNGKVTRPMSFVIALIIYGSITVGIGEIAGAVTSATKITP